nr:MAG TPA: hypothetical protein [Caudoviricetes sp.]
MSVHYSHSFHTAATATQSSPFCVRCSGTPKISSTSKN